MKEYNKLTQQLKDNSSDKFKTIELLTEFATKGELRSSGVCFVSFSNEYDVVNTLNLFSYDKNNFTI